MSMLIRYRRKDGFRQLLQLIESCAPQKCTQLMRIIQNEDPSIAALLKTKMLTMEKVFSWPPMVIAEVTSYLPSRTLAFGLLSLPAPQRENALKAIEHFKGVEIKNFLNEITPTPGEIEAARVKILSTVRELDRDLKIKLWEIDSTLDIRESKVA